MASALRFGRKLKMPSTRAIKHKILTMMLRDTLQAGSAAGDPPADIPQVKTPPVTAPSA